MGAATLTEKGEDPFDIGVATLMEKVRIPLL
jgi:hypothetical protein